MIAGMRTAEIRAGMSLMVAGRGRRIKGMDPPSPPAQLAPTPFYRAT
jgi:hypothetical protein